MDDQYESTGGKGKIMDRKLAETVLRAVAKKYERWIGLSRAEGVTDPDAYPKVVENFTYGVNGGPVAYTIVWEENAPDEWALRWGSAKREDPAGTFCEPVLSYVLGVYDGE